MNKELLNRIISSAILLPVVLFFIIKGSYFFNFFIIICFLISSYEWYMMSKNKTYFLLGLIFLILSFLSAYQIMNLDVNTNLYFLTIIMICVFTDIGGYLFGKIFKGPKLTKISPKKTYSGMIGGYLLSIIFLYLFYKSNYIFLKPVEMTLEIFIFILLISSISQLGDIIISYFKRLSKIKNTGNIIPGHGGLLDRIDGMIFAFPFSFIIFQFDIFQYF